MYPSSINIVCFTTTPDRPSYRETWAFFRFYSPLYTSLINLLLSGTIWITNCLTTDGVRSHVWDPHVRRGLVYLKGLLKDCCVTRFLIRYTWFSFHVLFDIWAHQPVIFQHLKLCLKLYQHLTNLEKYKCQHFTRCLFHLKCLVLNVF